MRTFQQIIEAAGFETRSYSGRGMYGNNCLGVDPDTVHEGVLFAEVLRVLDLESAEEVAMVGKAFRRMRSDSMGRGIVVYFPGEAYQDDGAGDEDDEDEDNLDDADREDLCRGA